jgi:hypothetical protein
MDPCYELQSDFASNYREAHFLLSHWWGGAWLVMYASTLHPIPLTPILTLFHTHTPKHTCLGFWNGLFPSGFPSRTIYAFSFLPCKLDVLPISNSAQLHAGVSQLFGCLQLLLLCICCYPVYLENVLLLSSMTMYNVLFTRHSLSSYTALNYLWCGYSILK